MSKTMVNSLPSSITVTETRETKLDLSFIKWAVVNPKDNKVYSLFKWKDRAEAYVKKYAMDYDIVELNP